MKRKCPNCKSTETDRALIFKRNHKGGTIVTDDTMWQCDKCDMSWTPGKKKDKP